MARTRPTLRRQRSSAAEQIAGACRSGAFVLDVNSASPRTKTACAEVIDRAGGRYVEAAVMSSVPPHGLRVPMLLGGPHATTLQPTLAKLGFAATVGSGSYGVVSAIKLCRSVIVKGMEALVIESLLAARRYDASRMTTATADVQGWIGMLRAEGVFATAASDPGWRELADLVRREAEE